jgi:signal transduction histidine kinase/ActR/RegA family two-component response regulator
MKHYVLVFLILCNILFANDSVDNRQLENVTIQLKWFYQYQFAGVFLAKEKGFYEEAGLDVTIKERDPSRNNILQVVDGEAEYGIADSVLLRYRAEGYDVKVIATIFQHNAMVLISKKESGIVSPYEMKGKSISYQKGLDDSIISSLLSFANIKDSDYVSKPMDFTHMDFVKGVVDISEAYISIEPFWLKEKYNIDVNIIDPKNYGIDFYGDLLFTTQKEIDNHPLRVQAFKQATLKGWAYALDHQEEAIQIILDKYNTRELSYKQLLYEARITKNLIATKYIPLGNVKEERFRILTTLYKNKGLSQKKLDDAVKSIIYDPDAKQNIFIEHRYEIIIATTILSMLVLLLFYNNRRLKYLVDEQTKELQISKEIAENAAQSKSIFLANMSHEIRTPMNAILGFIEQLKKEEDDPKKEKILQIVHDSGETLIAIINDILDITKIESDRMRLDVQKTNVFTILENVKALFQKSMQEKNIMFTVDISHDISNTLMLDDVRVKQIIINLLANAIKFTQEGGIISIQVFRNEDMLEIIFKDSGKGIAPQNKEKIFQSFEQEDGSTTRNFGGTGLGLSISKKLSNIMGGDITIESVLGQGSEFCLKIPYIESDEQKADVIIVTQTTESKSIKAGAKVLIVEDNKTNQLLLSMILDEYTLSYDIANDGLEAIEMHANNKYDLILMDENMPKMNGIEAVKKIREIEKRSNLKMVPIVAVTANALSGDRERFLEVGMNDYLAKPYHEEDIEKILLKYLGTAS